MFPDLPIFGARIVLNPQPADSHQHVSIKPIASGLAQPLRVGTTRAPVKSVNGSVPSIVVFSRFIAMFHAGAGIADG